MPQYEFLSLDVQSPVSEPLPNRFLKQPGKSHTLAIIFPGLNYSCDNPLLYYITDICTNHSIDVLQLWASYHTPEFQALSSSDQFHRLRQDGSALVAAGCAQRDYTRLILIGKSIGTLTLGALLDNPEAYPDAHVIWLTPLLRFPIIVRSMSQRAGKSIYVAGSVDRSFDTNLLDDAQQFLSLRHLLIDGADHSLHIPGNLPRSLDAMKQIMAEIETFITEVVSG